MLPIRRWSRCRFWLYCVIRRWKFWKPVAGVGMVCGVGGSLGHAIVRCTSVSTFRRSSRFAVVDRWNVAVHKIEAVKHGEKADSWMLVSRFGYINHEMMMCCSSSTRSLGFSKLATMGKVWSVVRSYVLSPFWHQPKI